MLSLPVLSCDNCARCCSQMRTPPFLGLLDPPGEGYHALPAELQEEVRRAVYDDRPQDSPCSWLDPVTLKCRHYDLRPAICRDFEMGGDGCLKWRATEGG